MVYIDGKVNHLTMRNGGKAVSRTGKCGKVVDIDGKVNPLTMRSHGKAVSTEEKCGKVVGRKMW